MKLILREMRSSIFLQTCESIGLFEAWSAELQPFMAKLADVDAICLSCQVYLDVAVEADHGQMVAEQFSGIVYILLWTLELLSDACNHTILSQYMCMLSNVVNRVHTADACQSQSQQKPSMSIMRQA